MKQWTIPLVFLILLLLAACDTKLMNGYSKLKDGVYYKIESLGDGEVKATTGDQVFAQIQLFGASGEELFNNNLQTGAVHQYSLSGTKNIWDRLFALLYEGDSMSVVLPGNEIDLEKLTQGKIKTVTGELTMGIKLTRLKSSNTVVYSEPVVTDDRELKELKDLKSYLEQQETKPILLDGIYWREIKRGTGNTASSGDQLWINYKGRFLNGEEFDNTYQRGQMLDFQLGKPDQVIKGFEIALHKMSKGSKVQLIIPSYLAFGEEGSSNGQVPGYTTVIYDLELVKIN